MIEQLHNKDHKYQLTICVSCGHKFIIFWNILFNCYQVTEGNSMKKSYRLLKVSFPKHLEEICQRQQDPPPSLSAEHRPWCHPQSMGNCIVPLHLPHRCRLMRSEVMGVWPCWAQDEVQAIVLPWPCGVFPNGLLLKGNHAKLLHFLS